MLLKELYPLADRFRLIKATGNLQNQADSAGAASVADEAASAAGKAASGAGAASSVADVAGSTTG